MKYMRLGVIRRLDANGRLQIPAEIRQYLQLEDGDLNVYVEDQKLIITRIKEGEFAE